MHKDKHVIETLGKVKVVIENGKISEIGESDVEYCPMFHSFYGVKKIDSDFIRKNIEFRIKDFGMCTPDRIIKMDDAVTVGISEILKTNMEKGNIDCVVGVCDGAGTILMENPNVVQGVGGRVSCIVKTTPIPKVIRNLEKEECVVLNPNTGEINQLEGLKLAIKKGYKNIAITVIPSKSIEKIRNYPVDDDVNIYIFVAHTSGCSEDETKMIFENADIVTACASKSIFEYADEHKPYYYGKKIPIFCASSAGRKFLDTRLKFIKKELTTNNYPRDKSDMPHKLI